MNLQAAKSMSSWTRIAPDIINQSQAESGETVRIIGLKQIK